MPVPAYIRLQHAPPFPPPPRCPFPVAGLVAVDLGYTAPIAAVATLLGAASPANLTLSMHVLDRLEDPLTNDSACAPPVAAVPGAWAAVPCNKTGR